MATLLWMAMLIMLSQTGTLVKADCFDNMISDITYTASSSNAGYPPSNAVLDNNGAWCTSQAPPNHHLDVNLGHLYDVCGVKVQSYEDNSVNSTVTKYKLAFSTKQNVWSYITDGNHLHKEFQIAPADANEIVPNELSKTRLASGVRFQPIEASGSPMCLRVAVYGIPAMNVSCDAFWMNVSISRNALGPDMSQLYLNQRSPQCTYNVDPNSDVTVAIKTGTCGMRATQHGNYVHFKNTVHGDAGGGAGGSITHTHDISFVATCIYERNATLSASYRSNNNFTLSTKEYGNLEFLMKGFRDSQHSVVLTPGAGSLAIGSRMYFSVEVISADKDLHLLLERCWATPTILRRDLSQRELVLQGCPAVQTDNSTRHSCDNSSLQKFDFTVFHFGVSDLVYVHCDVIVCFAGVQSSRCSEKCAACGDATGRKRRSLQNYDKGSKPYYLRIGPWQIQAASTEEGIDTSAGKTAQDHPTEYMTILLVVSGAVFVAIIISVVAVVILMRMRRKPGTTEQSKILQPGTPERERHVST